MGLAARTKRFDIPPEPKKSAKSSVLYGVDDTLMNLLCSYVVSQNKTIHKFSISNLNKVMTSINESAFDNNQYLIMKYRFLLRALKARMEGLTGDLVVSDVTRHLDTTALMQDPKFLREINNDEVKYAENTISQFVNTMVFDEKVNMFAELCSDYKQADYRTKELTLTALREAMAETMTEFRRADVARNSPSTRFRLSAIENSVEEIHNYICNPSYKLVTGMQGMNGLLGGGFQKTKLYCFFGMAGEGKTVTLVNLLYQIWKYNKGFKTKDPT